MEDGENRKHLGKLTEAIRKIMPKQLKEFIEKANRTEDDKITCVLADINMGWALEVAAELGIRAAAFWPASAFSFLLCVSIRKLIDDGVIDEYGSPINKHKMFQLSPTMPAMLSKYFLWACLGDFSTQKIMFEHIQRNNKIIEKADWLLCNSSYDLEPDGFNLAPKILLPIGPVSARDRLGNFEGTFWPEDTACLKWLDQHPKGSVIYVAFGNYTVFDQKQFQELALGLELCNRPFLWVVRPDFTKGLDDSYPNEFQDRVGLRVKRDEKGMITREEIKNKIDQLLGDEGLRGKALKLKELTTNSLNEGGSSNRIFKNFIEWIKS
ncbi:UDP-glucuronosyl/UDP-glucosyltransferase [Corchorus olitorius]|uniref:UDP-glucuronosyl/UDP-glucosyltransferase n=1 Tax=Corchorus olitorius TaxID=93759 RepID=A0A1R3KL42_9ROSI|nr:UDP-glucuronosyl/UDP-glucosyltransferase [Corchorus olitorius]